MALACCHHASLISNNASMSDTSKLDRLEAKINALTDMINEMARFIATHIDAVMVKDLRKSDTVLIDDQWVTVDCARAESDKSEKITVYSTYTTVCGETIYKNNVFNAHDTLTIKELGLRPR